jgi:hypothetical protein
MSSTYVACKLPEGATTATITQDVFTPGPPLIATFSALRDRLLRESGFEDLSGTGEQTIRYHLGQDEEGWDPHWDTIDYEFHGEPVNCIVLNYYPRRQFHRVLQILKEFGPFFVFDPQTGEFLDPSELQ